MKRDNRCLGEAFSGDALQLMNTIAGAVEALQGLQNMLGNVSVQINPFDPALLYWEMRLRGNLCAWLHSAFRGHWLGFAAWIALNLPKRLLFKLPSRCLVSQT